MSPSRPIERLLEIMARLRGPDGCPWDREQTHASIKPQLVEECYEVLEAIDAESPAMLKEELGDLLLHVVFHAQLADEAGHFNFDDLTCAINDKLVRRHPHVFGEAKAHDAAAVRVAWDAIKAKEKPERSGPLDGIPRHLPALMRAHEIGRKAAKVGFDWPDSQGPLAKIHEEVDELAAETDPERTEEELGDLLFALANFARHRHLDPEQALTRATDKFIRRFEAMRRRIETAGGSFQGMSLEAMDLVWEQVKGEGKTGMA
jgi:MazG family protein